MKQIPKKVVKKKLIILPPILPWKIWNHFFVERTVLCVVRSVFDLIDIFFCHPIVFASAFFELTILTSSAHTYLLKHATTNMTIINVTRHVTIDSSLITKQLLVQSVVTPVEPILHEVFGFSFGHRFQWTPCLDGVGIINVSPLALKLVCFETYARTLTT